MRYKDAPPDYPYWPSKYKPEEQSISDTQNSFEPPITREDAIALLRGHAAERFLGDFPKMENTEASPERALALAAYGAAQDLVERLSQKHSLVRPNLGNS